MSNTSADAEIVQALAKWMGWQVADPGDSGFGHKHATKLTLYTYGNGGFRLCYGPYEHVFTPLTKYDDARIFVDKFCEKHEEEYAWQLIKQLQGAKIYPSNITHVLDLLKATPRQMCLAVLKGIEAQ